MSRRTLRRVVVLVALAGVAVGAAAIVGGGGGGYVLYAQFRQAGGLRQGFKVRIDGAPVGKIDKLDLDSHDRVVAKLLIDESAAPVGRDVRATARAADLLGEKFVDLDPGDRGHPAPSGTVIPPPRTALAVELDDVINAVDLPTREALRVFVNEQGAAYVGRGRDLAATLAALPPSLDRTGALLDQFAQDDVALGRLVEESDRVVGPIAREHASLGRLVGAATGTLDTVAVRHRELGATVQRAPATLASAQRALAALEGAAIPLGPAARGLAATAPQLTATLNQLPAFADAARPTLRTVRSVAPTLQSLGRRGSPLVRRLQPLMGELSTFASALDPVTRTVDKGTGDILGVLEGWARSTQVRDSAGHLFRFGLTVTPATFSSIAGLMTPQKQASRRSRGRPRAAPAPAARRQSLPRAGAPAVRVPQLPAPKLPRALQDLPQKLGLKGGGAETGADPGLGRLLDYLLGA